MRAEPPSLEHEYPPVPAVVTEVRHGVRTMLAQWLVPEATAEDVLLVVEELLANVIDHARTPFRITVDRHDGIVRVAVHDRSVIAPQLRDLDLVALRGRGLRLVAAIARRWGYDEEDGGKWVWAEIPV